MWWLNFLHFTCSTQRMHYLLIILCSYSLLLVVRTVILVSNSLFLVSSLWSCTWKFSLVHITKHRWYGDMCSATRSSSYTSACSVWSPSNPSAFTLCSLWNNWHWPCTFIPRSIQPFKDNTVEATLAGNRWAQLTFQVSTWSTARTWNCEITHTQNDERQNVSQPNKPEKWHSETNYCRKKT